MASGKRWFWHVLGLQSGMMSILLSLLGDSAWKCVPGPSSDACCPLSPPRPSSRHRSALRPSLPLHPVESAQPQVRAAPAATMPWSPSHAHLHPHPRQPFSLTHALQLFLNDILLPGCGERKKKKRNTLPRLQAEDGVIAKC